MELLERCFIEGWAGPVEIERIKGKKVSVTVTATLTDYTTVAKTSAAKTVK